jgi:hypothetical protein
MQLDAQLSLFDESKKVAPPLPHIYLSLPRINVMHQRINAPPSTLIVCPVTKLLSSEHR